MAYIKNPESALPPGFRFHPTDEELILHYLRKKVASTPFPVSIIADVDIYKFDPWELPAKAAFGEKEWYFFSPRDRKYPNGARPNRAAASGYWKATGTDKIIMASSFGGGDRKNIGVKKALVFYKGRPPKGVKTSWIMHEYRLAESPNNFNNIRPMRTEDASMRLDDWVLCRIYRKSQVSSPTSVATESDLDQEQEEEQFIPDTLLPILKTPPIHNTSVHPQKSSSFSNLLYALDDYSMLSNFLSENQMNHTGFESTPSPFTSGIADHQQPSSFINVTHTSYNNNFFLQKLAPLTSASVPTMENKLKRPHPNLDEHILHHPSKKFINSCSFTNTITDQSDPQYNFFTPVILEPAVTLESTYSFSGIRE